MRNEYIMNLCMNGGVELAKINEVGHNFRYGIWTINFTVANNNSFFAKLNN